ncbi:MAG TPA: hypothetical protein VFS75_01380 [Candidatus Paceibacterota bacterium]|nr:hypothetical protein [Candidatus Paceibacterota bacterium]
MSAQIIDFAKHQRVAARRRLSLVPLTLVKYPEKRPGSIPRDLFGHPILTEGQYWKQGKNAIHLVRIERIADDKVTLRTFDSDFETTITADQFLRMYTLWDDVPD